MQQVKKQNRGKRLKKSRYITGFDGIRAIAVAGVIIYHLLPYNLQGGYMGVPIFFGVSGYLITDLLLQEWEQNGKIDFIGFYVRRLKRLYPALVTMLIATGAYITLFQRSLLANLRSIIGTNLVYLYNWWEVGHGQSYFDRFNGESPFTHLWSLSIEGQYYLIWPLLLAAMIILLRNKKVIAWIMLGLATLSAVLMGVLYTGPNTLNRVYYGTDTRMYAIIFGVALAIIWPSTHLKEKITQGGRWTLNIIGLLSFAVMMYLYVTLSGQNIFTYRGGMVIMTIASTLLIATCAHPGADVNRWLTNPLFAWIGTRSYGIYLFQFPVMIFYEMKVKDIAQHPLMHALIEVAIILIISELSYRYIERPLRRYDYSLLPGALKQFFEPKSRFGMKRLWALPVLFLMAACAYGTAIAPAKQAKTQLQTDITKNQGKAKKNNKLALEKQKKAAKLAKDKKRQNALLKKKLTKKQVLVAKKYNLTKRQYLSIYQQPVTAIGDSIMVDVSNDLQSVFKQAYVSAAVGRQIWQASSVLKQLKAKDQLASNVLINLGTNSPMTDSQINGVIKTIGPKRQIFWINCHVPTRNWETEVNRTINRAAKKHKNVHVIDWHGYSKGKSGWFWQDNVHPNPTGNVAFVRLVAKQVSTTLAK
ncbi:acyltransferase family protein [Lentilactobacillus sp. Marseille-Q4993]|uniref:acyltransferase family protein n=1 Tax=Lentilactobacillus sp. Marseille-Q4993 TaxID=3039492 RepID=UPI0024BC18CE|nr:acyltransferase family protein [Lentilactobacillus sp. Marseille-Q4993]